MSKEVLAAPLENDSFKTMESGIIYCNGMVTIDDKIFLEYAQHQLPFIALLGVLVGRVQERDADPEASNLTFDTMSALFRILAPLGRIDLINVMLNVIYKYNRQTNLSYSAAVHSPELELSESCKRMILYSHNFAHRFFTTVKELCVELNIPFTKLLCLKK
jgi:hypothetical protein